MSRAFIVLLLCTGCGINSTIVWETPPPGSSPSPTGGSTPSPTATLPPGTLFFTDFEADDGGFVITGNNPSWQWGVPTSGPNSAVSGANIWATNLSGDHNEEDSCIVSPLIDLPANPPLDLQLRFQMATDTDNNFDLWFIRIDDGSLSNLGSGSGESAQNYTARQYSLLGSAGATVRILFCLDSDSDGFTSPGIYVDDVGVYEL